MNWRRRHVALFSGAVRGLIQKSKIKNQNFLATALSLLTALHAIAQPLELKVENPKSKPQNPEAAATLVIFNNTDPMSVELAGYYAEKRGIPFDHLIGLDCSQNEEISRREFDRTIALPLRKNLELRGWWKVEEIGPRSLVVESRIRFVALMRGIPLKIAPEPLLPGENRPPAKSPLDSKDEASVDSELAALGFYSKNNFGSIVNPYYRSYTPALDVNMPMMLLVCRLDAPDAAMVRRMIDDSLEAEKSGLRGFSYVDGRGITDGPLAEGDTWLSNLANSERKSGIPVIFDSAPAMFPGAWPIEHAAFYYGWYSEQVAGPFARDDFRFVKGAVACHIHSFSASSIRDPHKYWVAPLLARGAAATMGNVYEPFLALTPNLDVFDDRLRGGFNFAESAYMSQRVLSWMTTFVGDPLYRPFASARDITGAATAPADEWGAYREGAQLWSDQGHAASAEKLRHDGTTLRSGIIFEGLGLLQAAAGETQDALQSFQQARQFYTGTGDILRTMIHEAGLLKAAGNKEAALKIVRAGIKTYPAAPATAVLRSMESEMVPASSPSSAGSPAQKTGNGHR